MLLSCILGGITEHFICIGEGLSLEYRVPVYVLHVFADFPIVPFEEV